MNKNAVYLAIFGVLCVLAGVIVGAGIVKKTGSPRFRPDRMHFVQKAEKFMFNGPKEMRERAAPGVRPKGGPGMNEMRTGMKARPGQREDGLFKMLVSKLALDQDQQLRVKEILEQTRREIGKVGENVREAISAIKDKSDQQIMEVLTTQQQEKFKALLEEFKKKYSRVHPGGKPMPMPGNEPSYPEGEKPPQE